MYIQTDMRQRSLQPFAVLVFPVFDGHILWVKHPTRGWEVPGGKLELQEEPESAAMREVFEESGADIENLQWIAEYETPDGNRKWIYFADVVDVGARPMMSETTDVCVPRPMWSPEEAQNRKDVSFIMKDAMYEQIWPALCARVHNAHC